MTRYPVYCTCRCVQHLPTGHRKTDRCLRS